MLGVLFAAAVATAAPPTQTLREPEAKVCRTEPIQGSRIQHKVCLTASEAAQLRRDGRAMLDHVQAGVTVPNMAAIVPMGPAGPR